MDNNQFKSCDYCDEQIKASAIFCRHCRTDLAPVHNNAVECPSCAEDISKDAEVCRYCRRRIAHMRETASLGTPQPRNCVQADEPRKDTKGLEEDIEKSVTPAKRSEPKIDCSNGLFPEFPYRTFTAFVNSMRSGEIAIIVRADKALASITHPNEGQHVPEAIHLWVRALNDCHLITAAVVASAALKTANWMYLLLLPLCWLANFVLDPMMGTRFLVVRRIVLFFLVGTTVFLGISGKLMETCVVASFFLIWLLLLIRLYIAGEFTKTRVLSDVNHLRKAWMSAVMSLRSSNGTIYSIATVTIKGRPTPTDFIMTLNEQQLREFL